MTARPETDLDTFTLSAMQDPYPALHQLREIAPVCWSTGESAWLLTTRDDVAAALMDRRLLVAEIAPLLAKMSAASGRDFSDLVALFSAVLLLRNPPGHVTERRFIARTLARWPLSRLTPIVERIATELLAKARRDGGIDLATGFADLLPPLVMAEMFGMPEQDALTLADLLADISEVFDRGRSLRVYQAMNEKAARVRALVLAVVRQRRKSPGDDAVSVMLALSGGEFCFDEAEIADRAIFLFMASIETTSGLIGCVLRALLLYTNERARLVNGEISPAEAFDELVRFSGPILQASRFAVEDVEVRGQRIAAGQRVVLMLSAANRDPAAWPDPDRLILGRPGPGNVAFGGGTHQCLGVGLAKLETCVAVEKFLQLRNPRLMSCEQAWMPLRTLRRLSHLPVTFG